MPNLKGTEKMSRIFASIQTNGKKDILLPTKNEKFSLASNGDIENIKALRKLCDFSEAYENEEELLLSCLGAMSEKNRLELLFKLTDSAIGNLSFVFTPSDENALYCKGGISKLFIGVCKSGAYVSNEVEAIFPLCDKYTVLENNQTAKIGKDKILFFDSRHKRIKKTFTPITEKRPQSNNFQIADNAFICSLSAKETFFRFVKSGKLSFDYMKLKGGFLNKINKVILVGSASAKNTATICRKLFETYCLIDTFALESEELITLKTPLDKCTLVIAISNNSEDNRLLEAISKAKESGAKTLALTDNKHSALALECDYLINPKRNYQSASLAAEFISNYFALSLFALWMGYKTRVISELFIGVSLKMAEMLSGIIQASTKASPIYDEASELMKSTNNIIVCSSSADYSLSLFGAQMIRKSLSKSAYSLDVSELFELDEKLSSSCAVFALITDNQRLHSLSKSLLKIKNRGAEIFIITSQSIAQELEGFESIITFNDSLPIFNPLPCISSLYKIALMAQEATNENDEAQSA